MFFRKRRYTSRPRGRSLFGRRRSTYRRRRTVGRSRRVRPIIRGYRY